MNERQDYYQRLYSLQDLVMAEVFGQKAGFYLTGGTALTRFYFQHRYSDDLDFFTGDPNTFGDAVRMMISQIESRKVGVEVSVDGRDFKRLVVTKDMLSLKVDLVADRVPRIGLPVYVGEAYVDTVRNILSNKVSAVLARDEARDIADVLEICSSRAFPWPSVLNDAQRKQAFAPEDLAYRIASFPPTALDSVPFQGKPPAHDQTARSLAQVAGDIVARTDNSLARHGAPQL